jgi:transglutaminase superfamily protein
MERLRKLWSITPRERGLLCEASILLLLSNACVKAIAFRHIERFLRIRWNDDIQSGIGYEKEITLVQRSISRATNVLPWKARCLSQSITQFIMLRRRGIRAILLAGVRFSGHSSLDAHAWVDTDLATDNKSKSNENASFAPVIRIGGGAR